jgi:tetratricopeptide (TPR) repeat protein
MRKAFLAVLVALGCGFACQPLGAELRTAPALGYQGSSQAGIFLVFPFDNEAVSPRLEWLGEGLEELTIQRIAAAGLQVYSHAGRAQELDRYGLPASAQFSHATMLRVAGDLDADYVIFGSFSSDGATLKMKASLLRVNPPALLPPVEESGRLDSLMEMHTRLVWRLLSENDRAYPLSLAEFSRKQRPLRLDAFEHYVRGLLANDDNARTRELREATRIEPNWPDPAFALGQAYFSLRQCDQALPWFAKIPQTHARYAESLFSTGVCRLLMNQAPQAEQVFTSLQTDLHADLVSGGDLPEILNDRAIALARQGKYADAIKDLRRATQMDPDEDDYPFNLGLLEFISGDAAASAIDFREAVEREPTNGEDRAMLIAALEKAGKKSEAEEERAYAAEALGPGGLPSVKADARAERIKMELDTTALQLEIESPAERPGVSAAAGNSPATSPASSADVTPAMHVRRGRKELAAGRLDSAEQEFRAVLAAEPHDPSAHRALGEIYRQRGKLDQAASELLASLAARDSAVVRTVLARVYLDQKKPELARAQLQAALKLAPNYTEAKQMLARLPAKPAAGRAP